MEKFIAIFSASPITSYFIALSSLNLSFTHQIISQAQETRIYRKYWEQLCGWGGHWSPYMSQYDLIIPNTRSDWLDPLPGPAFVLITSPSYIVSKSCFFYLIFELPLFRICEKESFMHLKFYLILSWFDRRLTFKNLNKNAKLNGLTDEKTLIWTPKLKFINTQKYQQKNIWSSESREKVEIATKIERLKCLNFFINYKNRKGHEKINTK